MPVDGVPEFESRMDRMARRITEELVKTGNDIQLDLAGKAAIQTPKDTGELESSVATGGEVLKEGKRVVILNTAGRGPSSKYARYQHNTPSLNHPKKGKAFFLRDPFKENVKKYIEWLADAVKRGTHG